VTVALKVTLSPTNIEDGVAEHTTVIGLPAIIRLKLVVLPSGEPVTVIEWVPTGADGPTVKVIVEVQVGLQGFEDIE
jgi:hypothetical protein